MNVRILPIPDPVHELDLGPEVVHVPASGGLTVKEKAEGLGSGPRVGIDLGFKRTKAEAYENKDETESTTR